MTLQPSNGNDDMNGKGPKSLLIVGAGQRGMASSTRLCIVVSKDLQVTQIYSQYALQHPDLIKIIGVADLSPFRRKVTARTHE